MKIVCFLPHKIVGGVEQRVIRYANRFHSLGHSTTLVLLKIKQIKPQQDLPLNLFTGEIVHFESSLFENQYHVVKRLSNLIKSKKCDVIWINGETMSMNAASLMRKDGGPLIIYHISGDSPHYLNMIKTYSPVIDLIISFNKSLRDKISGITENVNHILYLPFGIQAPAQYIPKDISREIRLVYAGKISYGIKNVQSIIPLLINLESKHINYKLDIIGDGESRADLESQVTKLNLHDKVKFWGYLEYTEAQKVLSQAHIILLFSITEGLPNAVIEGMSHGLVPIVKNANWVNTVINNNENGFIFSAEEEAADIIKQLSNDKDKYNKISYNAYHTTRNNFNFDESVRQYLDIFEQTRNSYEKKRVRASIPVRYSRLDKWFIPNWVTIGARKLVGKISAT